MKPIHFAAISAIAALACTPASANAQPSVALDSAVYVERINDTGRSLQPVQRLSRGDRVVTVVTWFRMGGDGGFTVTNPLPRAISYQRSADDNEQVSVDGGKTWGRLETLRVAGRMATPEDVTHVRWQITPNRAARGRGQIAYAGIVR